MPLTKDFQTDLKNFSNASPVADDTFTEAEGADVFFPEQSTVWLRNPIAIANTNSISLGRYSKPDLGFTNGHHFT